MKFITFGSHSNFIDTGKRLIKQVTDINLFTETKLYSVDDLKNDIDFWNRHNIFISNNKRGYGYWLWKPYIILKNYGEYE